MAGVVLLSTLFVFCSVLQVQAADQDLLKNFVKPSLAKLNHLREEFGLSFLKLDDQLVSGAQEWAESEAKDDELKHSCSPCDNYSELLAEKITTGEVPKGHDAVEWALNRWFGDLLTGTEPTTEAKKAYSALLKKPNLIGMGIGIAYGQTSKGEKTAFAVARFVRSSKKKSKSG